jgi:hypothetical protein
MAKATKRTPGISKSESKEILSQLPDGSEGSDFDIGNLAPGNGDVPAKRDPMAEIKSEYPKLEDDEIKQLMDEHGHDPEQFMAKAKEAHDAKEEVPDAEPVSDEIPHEGESHEERMERLDPENPAITGEPRPGEKPDGSTKLELASDKKPSTTEEGVEAMGNDMAKAAQAKSAKEEIPLEMKAKKWEEMKALATADERKSLMDALVKRRIELQKASDAAGIAKANKTIEALNKHWKANPIGAKPKSVEKQPVNAKGEAKNPANAATGKPVGKSPEKVVEIPKPGTPNELASIPKEEAKGAAGKLKTAIEPFVNMVKKHPGKTAAVTAGAIGAALLAKKMMAGGDNEDQAK